MCGRFNITSDPLAKFLLEWIGVAYNGKDNFNLAPTELVHVLRLNEQGQPESLPMRWWLTPFWAKALSSRYSMFNAKSETAAESPAFKAPFAKRRCVVPISGFYEWCRQNNQKLPYLIKPEHDSGLLLAGLWDSWRYPESGDELLSFTILTTAAHADMAFVHHRQPVILDRQEAQQWLDMRTPTSELEYLFASRLPVSLEVVPVSTHVNNARNKEARCAQSIGASIPIGSEIH